MDELRKNIKSVWLRIKQLRDAKESAEQLIDLLLETAREKNAPAAALEALQEAKEELQNYYFDDAMISLYDADTELKN